MPIAGRLVARGVAPAAAVTFLLSAPAVNPVVLVATAVAFPGRPEMVLARFLASLLTACVVGFVWIVKGRDEWVAKARRNEREDGVALRHLRGDRRARLPPCRRLPRHWGRHGRIAADAGAPLDPRQRRRPGRRWASSPWLAWP